MTADKAAALGRSAESSLASCRVEIAALRSCDILVCCDESTEHAEQAVRSALAQKDAIAIVHLVDDGGGGADLVRQFGRHWNVATYRNPARRGTFATLHDLLPRLRSEFLAIQDPRTISHPDRIATSVTLLHDSGGEILAAPLQTPAQTLYPRPPGRVFRPDVPSQTLVFRRASLLDMGGIAFERRDPDVELIFRAAREGRKIVLAPRPTVTAIEPPIDHDALDPAPRYRPRGGSLRHHAIGYPEESVAADVVLPFHGALQFLKHSVPSALEQDGAETIVHLIDDGTPGGAEDVLRYWGSHPRIRTYKNIRNVGQFASFNSVARYFETGLAAVQDADDLSRPNRVRWAGNLLRLADAEVFGGAARPFPDPPGVEEGEVGPIVTQSHEPLRSNWPHPGVQFFLLNPTAVFRASTFDAMRGFSDYGDLECNKCGLDTEFYIRAFYGGARFAISREIVVNYRIHTSSAVNNSRTGWGSPARLWSETENFRRFAEFQKGPFDPRVFGALRDSQEFTVRLNHP
jgi:hypothetical protein